MNKKSMNIKLLLGIFLLGIGIGSYVLYKNGFLNKNISTSRNLANLEQSVKGLQTSILQPTSFPSSNSNSYLQNTISDIQQQAQNLNLAQIASSSPQIQQIIQQIQNLPQVPANDAKQACMQLCNKL